MDGMARPQWSLGQMFVAMTAACLFLGIVGWIAAAAQDAGLPPIALFAILAGFAAFVILALAKSSTL